MPPSKGITDSLSDNDLEGVYPTLHGNKAYDDGLDMSLKETRDI